MARQQLSLKELQSLLGHARSTHTLDIYGNILNESTDKTATQIDNIFESLEENIKEINNRKQGKVVEFRNIK